MFSLSKDGYITQYLYSGRKESVVDDNNRDTNQLRYEKYLRGVIAKHEENCLQQDVHLGEISALGMEWNYFYSHENVFLEKSAFYLDLRKVELLAYTEILVEEDLETEIEVFSCGALNIWLNQRLAGKIEKPVYKPIQNKKLCLSLKKGKNPLFVYLETLGVRDTRISVAIRFPKDQEKIKITLPDEERMKAYWEAAKLLDHAQLEEGRITFSHALPAGSTIRYNKETVDFRTKDKKFSVEDISGQKVVFLKPFASCRIEILVNGQKLGRNFEQIILRKASFLNDTKEHLNTYKKIAAVTSITRGANDGFAMYPMLARYYLGLQTENDMEELHVTLKQIERRMDCADFMTCALVRFLKNYSIDASLEKEMKETMLSFRYWMDEEGQDAMCFWSENHSLMFYQTAYFFGEMYPKGTFTRSGKTGEEMHRLSGELIRDWLIDVLEFGFDEFNSGVYSAITFAALLNVVDYAEKELSDMAKEVCDILIRTMAVHCFKKVVISPQGRIYRDVLYPQLQSLQSLVHYIDPTAPYVFSEWLICLATSSYRMPEDVKELMEQMGSVRYTTSNAAIRLYKQPDYMLTSVESPREDRQDRTWQREEDREKENTHPYTKSLNECFHGTMLFEPGTLGYQQHLWYAALDEETVVFVNHPGGSSEEMPEIRPGYWYGNGSTPALKQEKNILGAIYEIPKEHPISFTHLYFPKPLFDEVSEEEHWICGRKKESFVAVWCSNTLCDFDEVLYDCEKRAYGSRMAYVCICKSKEEYGSFEEFIFDVQSRKITFSKESAVLKLQEFELTFSAHENKTQYVE